MNRSPRPRRWFRLLVLLLLVGMAGGAAWFLGPLASLDGTGRTKTGTPAAVPNFYCGIGHVDVKDGVIDLNPEVVGRVDWVAKEGAIIQPGQPVLKMDPGKLTLEQEVAREEVIRAKRLLDEAFRAPDKHRAKLNEMQAAIDAADKAIQEADAELGHKRGEYSHDLKHASILAAAAKKARMQDLKKYKQAELDTLKLEFPEDAIWLALSNVQMTQRKLELAELILRKCEVTAPTTVKVLRALVRKGEALPHPGKPVAVQVCPCTDQDRPEGMLIIRGEVEQEWAWKLQLNQAVDIQDDAIGGRTWFGVIDSIDDWQGQRQHPIQQPFQNQDVRRLGFVVRVAACPEGAQGNEPHPRLWIGQRMRLRIYETK